MDAAGEPIDSNWHVRSNTAVPKAAQTTRSTRPRSRLIAAIAPDPILTVEELMAYLKLPKSTVYKLAQEGKIPGQKVGRHWRFSRAIIDQWLGASIQSDGMQGGKRHPTGRRTGRS